MGRGPPEEPPPEPPPPRLVGVGVMVGVGVGKAVAYVFSSIAMAVLIGASVGFVLPRIISFEYEQYNALVNMQITEVSEYGAVYNGPAFPLERADRARPRLEVIRERGSLRVGYLRDRLPGRRVADGALVEFHLDGAIPGDGTYNIAIDSTSSDGVSLRRIDRTWLSTVLTTDPSR